MSKNKKFVINLVTLISSMLINYGINFLFTPYLIAIAGSEAFGFVNLANNMVNYATIITVAISSVAGRFITIKVHQNLKEEANSYFNSVFWSNIILVVLLLCIFIPIIINLDRLISIPLELIKDVKQLFVFVAINFVITISSNVFNVATFIRNKLYLTSMGNCIASFVRVLFLCAFFGLFPTNVAYISVTACICSFLLCVYNVYLTNSLVPDFKISINKFRYSIIKELLGAGIWSSISKMSQILSEGLDLLICNLLISSYAMGQLAIGYTIPNIIKSLLANLTALFEPQQTYYFARGELQNLLKAIRQSMRFTGYIFSIIFAGYVVFGYEFYSLWVPSENVKLIYQLSLLSSLYILVAGVTSGLDSVFLLTNNLKKNSIVWLIVSLFDLVTVLLFVKNTAFGIFAIAGVSKIVAAGVDLIYTPIYASICLGLSRTTFYPLIGRYILNNVILIVIFAGINYLISARGTWSVFFIKSLFSGSIGMITNYFLFLTVEDRSKIKGLLVRKMGTGVN